MRRITTLAAFGASLGALLLAAPAMAGPKAGAPKVIPKDARLWAAAEAARAGQLQLLQQAVNIDSGTGDAEGGRKVEALLIPRLKALGATIETVPAEAPGLPENLVARFSGTGKGRILMIGHIDTVFGPGTVATRPWPGRRRCRSGRASGSGPYRGAKSGRPG